MFAKVMLNFEFDGSNSDTQNARLFLLEKPWDAVPSLILLNGESLTADASADAGPQAVAPAQLQALEEALSVPSSHLLVMEIAAGTELSTLAFEFTVAVDLQWHRGAFRFRSPDGSREVDFGGRWELSGLPGAGIAFTGAASACRLETLEGTRHRWSEPLTVSPEQPAVVEFSLDEKKAASIAVFSPPSPSSSVPGCAAVAVVAPVRPQLAREPVRLAILVEVRNPQDGLLLRSMVEKVTTLLKAQDEFCLLLLGTSSPDSLVPWSSSETVDDAMLAKLLQPSAIGRATDLWGNLESLSPHLAGSTHLLLASSGAPTFPNKGLVSSTPVFVFATGRRPFKSQLESLSQRSGGFLMEGTLESVDSLLERMRIRLSPPLLSEFKLEGWGLEHLRPSAATQVYTDQPTLVFGLYDGLLPKTVTLSGQSPSRQKLAQRVKVETLSEIDLMPLYQDRVARWDGEAEPVYRWKGGGTAVRNVSHAEALPSHYISSAPSAFAMEIDMGAPPTLSFDTVPVTFDDEILGAPSFGPEPDLFSSEDSGESSGVDIFADTFDEADGDATASDADLYFGDATAMSAGSPQIRKAAVELDDEDSEDGVDLFDDPATARARLSKPAKAEAAFEIPAGRPTIARAGESAEIQAAPDSSPSESPTQDPQQKRRLLSPQKGKETKAAATARGKGAARAAGERPPSHWWESLRTLDPEAAQEWLEGCSIDQLGLAASLMAPEIAEELLGRLDSLRRRAVRTQIEWGRLLETRECQEADQQLAQALSQA